LATFIIFVNGVHISACMAAIASLINMNDVHVMENHMLDKVLSFAAALVLSGSVAFAGPSTQHSAQASNHSAAATSHGSAALASGAGIVVAVPVMVVGAALSLSGAALQSTGNGAMSAGSQMIESAAAPMAHAPTPDGPPTLDGTSGANR
jgi:hypothetical protein